ncbi:MAG: phenylacetate--CoA ligase [Deltaproteobacteria bacterium RBG_16_48_10]|nr:MAG: phenylacetate--CoA ligase [Deltaproteobacteria bacterium RBG_16_48_10]
MKYWDEKFETMPEEGMRKFQLEYLKKTLKWVYEKIPFYKNKFDEKGVKPDDLKTLKDLSNFPFTVKTDLRDNYPFGLCAVPLAEVVRIHASSGTTGKPITGPYTAKDLEQWTECMARSLYSHGVRSNDICQNSYGMGLFTGGLGFHQGATRIGAAVIPISSGQTERQIIIMNDFGTTVLFSTPTYALTIAERAEEMGVKLKDLPLRVGSFGAEPWTIEMRKEIEQRMGIKAMECYGLTEFGGPGTGFDCIEQEGLHLNEDHFIPEIIDPVTEQILPTGTKGELVFTAIQREAMPLIRYRTRDITTLRREKCPCGRTLLKMDKIYGRSDDMLIIGGVNVFPSQIESILLEIPEVEPQYVIILRKKGYLDQLHVDVEAKKEVYDLGPQKVSEVEKMIEGKMRGIIGIGMKIRLVPPKSITRSEGKAKRIFDERKL